MNTHASNRPVIVATPLGEESDAAVARRAPPRPSRSTGRRLLLHADTPPPILLGAPGGGLRARRRAARPPARRADGGARRPGPRRRRRRPGSRRREVRIGPADLVLAAVAEERDAELVVLGPPRRPELGTTADRLLRRIDRPVLVLRRPDRDPAAARAGGGRPLGARRRRRWWRVCTCCASCRDRRRRSSCCSPCTRRRWRRRSTSRPTGSAPSPARSCSAWRGAPCRSGPACVDLCVRPGEARDVILEEAAARDADLVVLGTHGRAGLERWLLGSVAAAVLRRASTNLLVVPRHAHAGERGPALEDRRRLPRRPPRRRPAARPRWSRPTSRSTRAAPTRRPRPSSSSSSRSRPAPGYYALRFCESREIPLDGLGRRARGRARPGSHGPIDAVRIRVTLPAGFPERYREPLLRAVDQCAVKKLHRRPGADRGRAGRAARSSPPDPTEPGGPRRGASAIEADLVPEAGLEPARP